MSRVRRFSEKNKEGDQLTFIQKAIAVHGSRYDYSLVDYGGMRVHVRIKCSEHGEFSQAPADHLNGNNCPECAKRTRAQSRRRYDYNETDKFLLGRWRDIKRRCTDTEWKKYYNYGGRGIKISDEFLNWDTFREYVTTLPHFEKVLSDKLTLDRINNDGNYERGNLRWATPELQGTNMRSRAGSTGEENIIHKRGKCYSVTVICCSKRHYLGRYDTLEEAVKVRDEFKARINPIIEQNQKI